MKVSCLSLPPTPQNGGRAPETVNSSDGGRASCRSCGLLDYLCPQKYPIEKTVERRFTRAGAFVWQCDVTEALK